jgi:23S rRNA (pseudouridine1915-N3)-methyltransferase
VNIHILTIGRLKDGPMRQLANLYADRIVKAGPQAGLKSLAIREFDEARASSAPQRKAREADKLAAAQPPASIVVALDETGKDVSSRQLAGKIATWRDDGETDLVFLVGGPDGLDPDLVRQARLVLAFGKNTWPHQLVRVMLLEQIYRVTTLLLGHPYHRD